MNKYQIYRIITQKSINPSNSLNGGDYEEGIRFATLNAVIVAGEHFTSREFPYCSGCGLYHGDFDEEIERHSKCRFQYDLTWLMEQISNGSAQWEKDVIDVIPQEMRQVAEPALPMDANINFKLSSVDRDRLVKEAHDYGMSVSALIRQRIL